MALDKAEQDLLNDKNTIVIVPEHGSEYQVAIKWLRTFAPRVISEQRVFTQLSLSSLQGDTVVCTVTRNSYNPIQVPQIDIAGFTHYPNRPEKELEAEVVLSAPVKVSKYWTRDNPMRPGRPDTAGILEALGVATSPWRLDFIDKGEDKPQLMILGKG